VTTTTYLEQFEQFDARQRHALAMEGAAKLEQRRVAGALDARERIEGPLCHYGANHTYSAT
jgi:hypothetical protein